MRQRMRLYVRSLFVQEEQPRHTILEQVPRQGDPESARGLYTLASPGSLNQFGMGQEKKPGPIQ